LALAVEGYWNHEVRFDPFAGGDLSEAISKPPAQRLDLLKLQHDNRADQRGFVLREAARPVEAPRACSALWTKEPLLFAVARLP